MEIMESVQKHLLSESVLNVNLTVCVLFRPVLLYLHYFHALVETKEQRVLMRMKMMVRRSCRFLSPSPVRIRARLTQNPRGGLCLSASRFRPLRLRLLGSVSVPGALRAVAGGGSGGGRGAAGRRGCGSACRRRRPRVGHDQRGAARDQGVVRESVSRNRISGGGLEAGGKRPTEGGAKGG